MAGPGDSGGLALTSIAWDPSSGVFTTSGSNNVYSTDGVTWTLVSNVTSLSNVTQRVTYSPLFGLLVANNNGTGGITPMIATTSDGHTTTSRAHYTGGSTGSHTFRDSVDNGSILCTVGRNQTGLTGPVQISGLGTVYTVSVATGTWTANTTNSPFGANSVTNSPFGDYTASAPGSIQALGTAIGCDGTTFAAAGTVNASNGSRTGLGFIYTTSPSGSWSAGTSPWDSSTVAVVNRIAWGSGAGWVAVGTNGLTGASCKVLLTSSDGHTWTQQSTPIDGSTSAVLKDVVWSSALSLWTVVGSDGAGDAVVLTSPDGATWTRRDNGDSGVWNGIAWSSSLGLLVAVGHVLIPTGPAIWTSPDGSTWTQRSTPAGWATTGAGVTVEWANYTNGSGTVQEFVAAATTTSTTTGLHLARSTDGINWTDVTGPPTTDNPQAIGVPSPGLSLGSALALITDFSLSGPLTIYGSNDGVTLTLYSATDAHGLIATAAAGLIYSTISGKWVFSSNGSNVVATSPDGLTWTSANLTGLLQFTHFNALATDGSTYVVGMGQTSGGGSNSATGYSTDGGVTWNSTNDFGLSDVWHDCAYCGGTIGFVGVGTANLSGVVAATLTGAGGATWSAHNLSATFGNIIALDYAPSLAKIVMLGKAPPESSAAGNRVGTSTNGTTASVTGFETANPYATVYDVAWSPQLGLFVIVGSGPPAPAPSVPSFIVGEIRMQAA